MDEHSTMDDGYRREVAPRVEAALDKAVETLMKQGFCAQGKLGPKVLPKSILEKHCPACIRDFLFGKEGGPCA